MTFLKVILNNNELKFENLNSGFQTRHISLSKMIEIAYSSIKDKLLSKTKIIFIYSDDFANPIHFNEFKKNNPDVDFSNVFICSGTIDDFNNNKLLPDFGSHSWPEAKILDFQSLKLENQELGKLPPKYNKIFWIGSIETHYTRYKLLQIALSRKDIFECIPMNWNGPDNNPTPNRFITLPEHTQYKYLIDIQGRGYSGRLKYLATMNRIIFVQERKYWDILSIQMKPWIHYIPIKEDLSDLIEKYEWAESHTKECEIILQNLKKYVDEKLNSNYINKYFEDIMLKI